jgi:hypothetical protein
MLERKWSFVSFYMIEDPPLVINMVKGRSPMVAVDLL